MDSPFQSHLNTNYTPSDEEIKKISTFLVEPLSKLSRLDSQINDLLKERNALKKSIEAHRALMSPFRRLPCDLIREVFLWCLPTDRNCAMSCDEAPVLLSRVCSDWRQITMTTPAMWTSLHIPVPDLSDVEILSAKTKQRTGVVHEWLRRSSNLPLSISFFGKSGTEQLNSGLLFKEVLRHSKRWKRMRFEVSTDLAQSIITLSQDQVPTLESLTIINLSDFHSVLLTQSFPPSLHRLSLIGLISTQRLGTLQLTHLTIHHRSREGPEPLRILKECSQLTSCDLSLPCGTIDKRLVVTLPYLQELYFHEVTNSADFFTHLTLPVLRRLKFRTSLASTNGSLLAFLSHIFKLGTKLKCLDLECRSFSSAGIIKCLDQTPYLSRLVFTGIDHATSWVVWTPAAVTTSFFEKMTPNNCQNGPCWLPHLEEFECDVVDSFSHQSLLTAIRTRAGVVGAVRKLDYLELNIKCDVEQDFVVGLQNLVAQGLLRLQLNFISGRVIHQTCSGFSPWNGIWSQPSLWN